MKIILNLPQSDINFLLNRAVVNDTNFTTELIRCINTLKFFNTCKEFNIKVLIKQQFDIFHVAMI
jgi:hypothetical protein